jgi:hypothetical protein
MMQCPSHIPLYRRKGLAMRMMVAAILEDNLPQSESAYVEYNQLLRQLYVTASGDRNITHQRLDTFLHESAKHIRQYSASIPTNTLRVQRRIADLNYALETFNCSNCNKYGDICHNTPMDAQLFDNSMQCLSQLKDIFYFIIEKSRLLQKAVCGRIHIPMYSLSTGIIDSDSPTIPKNVNISGSYNVDSKEISIIFREDALNKATLVQVIYVISHEILCHGMQGILGIEKENADEHCSWTEGFMDRLAFFHVDDWLTNDRTLPDWLTQHKPFSQRHCLNLHQQRIENSRLTRSGKIKRYFAYDVCDNLREAFVGRHSGDSRRLKGFFHFCHLLNFQEADSAARQEILFRIGLLLDRARANNNGSPSADYFDVLFLCGSFLHHRDISQLIRDLENIAAFAEEVY